MPVWLVIFVVSFLLMVNRLLEAIGYVLTYPFNYKRIRAERAEYAAKLAAFKAQRQAEIEERSKEYRLIGQPGDDMTVLLFTLPLSFLEKAEYPEYMDRFFFENNIIEKFEFGSNKFGPEEEWEIARVLHHAGGAFVVSLDSAGFATGVEVWFKDQDHADAFVQKYLWYPDKLRNARTMEICTQDIDPKNYEIVTRSNRVWFKNQEDRQKFRAGVAQYYVEISGPTMYCLAAKEWCKKTLEPGTWDHWYAHAKTSDPNRTVTFYFENPANTTMFTMMFVR